MTRPPLTRRALLGLATAGVVGLAGCSGLQSLASTGGRGRDGTDGPAVSELAWPNGRHDAAGTGHVSDERLPEDPTVAWRYDHGGATFYPPVAADGVVYVASRGSLAVDGEADSGVHAVDTADGSRLWHYHEPLDSDPDSDDVDQLDANSLATNGETVFVQAGVALHALDAATGERQWLYRTNSSFRGMTVTDGLVIFASRKTSRGGDGGESVIALDVGDGSERWQTVVGGNTGPMATPVVADDTVYAVRHESSREAADEEMVVFALDRENGEVGWKNTLNQRYEPFSLPAVADDTLVYGMRDLHAFDTDDGSVKWTDEETVDAEGHLVPAVADDAVFVTHDGGVSAFEQLGGTRRWHHEEPDTSRFPVVAGGDLLVAARDGLHAYDVASGDERLHALEGEHPFLGSPIVVDETVYLPNGSELLALE